MLIDGVQKFPLMNNILAVLLQVALFPEIDTLLFTLFDKGII